ncbi:MAG: hypothetical protein K5673_02365 [Lachnospiraceae bacterium]|nr:hypothetical protein [Lachnospiraceae bacterium]
MKACVNTGFEKTRYVLSGICICLMLSLCSCTIKSDRPISDKVINERKEAYENYLKETYPDESFTVEIWQEYGTDIGGAGLPDYEGYLIRQVITDSRGNRFKIHEYSKGEYSDDYQKVLDGWIRYDEKGELILNAE